MKLFKYNSQTLEYKQVNYPIVFLKIALVFFTIFLLLGLSKPDTQYETGHWNSKIFKENHNLFGMKEARVRLNLAEGTQHGHAYYNNWEESVMDYALWYSTYAYKCKTEKQLYKLLDKQYAEADAYVSSLQHIIKINNLKEKFE